MLSSLRPTVLIRAHMSKHELSQREFRDDGRALLSFADRVRVRCRKCQAAGVVLMRRDRERLAVTFRCGACGAGSSSAGGDWAGPRVIGGRRHCALCGYNWSVAPRPLAAGAPTPQHVKAWCPRCEKETRTPAVISPGVSSGEPTDPYLGLPLLLVTETRFGPLWCYNEEHFAFLRDYVSAGQRRRTSATHHHSMFVRLPAWMKLAKNRAEMLKGLARIEAMIAAAD